MDSHSLYRVYQPNYSRLSPPVLRAYQQGLESVTPVTKIPKRPGRWYFTYTVDGRNWMESRDYTNRNALNARCRRIVERMIEILGEDVVWANRTRMPTIRMCNMTYRVIHNRRKTVKRSSASDYQRRKRRTLEKIQLSRTIQEARTITQAPPAPRRPRRITIIPGPAATVADAPRIALEQGISLDAALFLLTGW